MKNLKKNFLFVAIFAVLGFLALQIPVTEVIGSGAKFTFFDSLAPIFGAFIGSVPAVLAVFLMQLGNFLFHGAEITDAGTIIRFFPMLFAVLYFAKKRKTNLAIPLIAILVFLLNPIGREVWFFSLFWLIPIVAFFFQDKFLLARSLGATFTAHSVGGALWVWFVPMPAEIWISLIPIVLAERLMFALGIALSFVLANNVLCLLERKLEKNIFRFGFRIEPKYIVSLLKR